MSLHIIIDGYNLIRQTPRLANYDRQDIELGRQMLIEELALYKKTKHHRITVVFDGAQAPLFSQSRDRIKGIDIQFSRLEETADTLIKKIAAKEKQKALVVTSDREIVEYAISHGAAVIRSQDFGGKIVLAVRGRDDVSDSYDDKGWNVSTKKKGPSRRLSKRERKNKLKISKL